MRFLEGLVHMAHRSQPEPSVVIVEEGHVKYDEERENKGEDEPECTAW